MSFPALGYPPAENPGGGEAEVAAAEWPRAEEVASKYREQLFERREAHDHREESVPPGMAKPPLKVWQIHHRGVAKRSALCSRTSCSANSLDS